jgi:hypothetical protein
VDGRLYWIGLWHHRVASFAACDTRHKPWLLLLLWVL